MGRTIAVTGVSGYLGKTLLGLLERHPEVDHVIGLDTREIPIRTPKLEFHTFDVLDPGLPKMVAGADTLVHLAFCVDPMRDEALMHAVNVGGFRCVLDAVEEARISKLVYPSSAWAYGAHPDNPVPLREGVPLRPNTGFSYAEHKAETEALLTRWSAGHPDVSVTVLRPATTIGPHVSNFMSRFLEGPRLLGIRGYAAAAVPPRGRLRRGTRALRARSAPGHLQRVCRRRSRPRRGPRASSVAVSSPFLQALPSL